MSDEINSAVAEIVITEEMLKNGNKLSDLSLPDVLVTMIKRGGEYLVHENTPLEMGIYCFADCRQRGTIAGSLSAIGIVKLFILHTKFNLEVYLFREKHRSVNSIL